MPWISTRCSFRCQTKSSSAFLKILVIYDSYSGTCADLLFLPPMNLSPSTVATVSRPTLCPPSTKGTNFVLQSYYRTLRVQARYDAPKAQGLPTASTTPTLSFSQSLSQNLYPTCRRSPSRNEQLKRCRGAPLPPSSLSSKCASSLSSSIVPMNTPIHPPINPPPQFPPLCLTWIKLVRRPL